MYWFTPAASPMQDNPNLEVKVITHDSYYYYNYILGLVGGLIGNAEIACRDGRNFHKTFTPPEETNSNQR